MLNNLKIRKAGINKISTVIDLAGSVWPLTYKDILSAEQVEYMMNLFYSRASLTEQFNSATFIIAWKDEYPVGFASYGSSDKAIYKLHKLYVLRSVQGMGVGKALVGFIVDEARPSGCRALELNVNRNNSARSFYERLGFRVIREEDNDIGNGFWMNDYVMRLEL